ncbi:MAG: hypothetical protein ACO1SX_08155 [Actinomycetota bacterium]
MAIPRLGKDVPLELRLNPDNQQATAAIVGALLDEGILQESDWKGSLSSSLQSGLVRWVHELGAGDLHIIRPELSYLDDISASAEMGYGFGAYEASWRNAFDGDRLAQGGCAVGGFALSFGDASWGGDRAEWGQEVVMKPRIQQLEKLQKGAGWSVYALARDALNGTVLCACPRWCADFLRYSGIHDTDYGTDAPLPADIEDEELLDDPEAVMTYERFSAGMPDEFFGAKWDPKPIQQIIRRRRRMPTPDRSCPARSWGESPEIAELLNVALELAALAEGRPPEPNQWGYFFGHNGQELAHPVLLRWSERDAVHRVWDDYLEGAHCCEGVTEITWIHGFQVDRPDTIREAARALAYTLRVVIKVDRLLQLLHEPDSLASRLAQTEAPVRIQVQL